MEIVVRESVPVLLDKLGLANGAIEPLPVSLVSDGTSKPKSFVPDGDQIEIPSWVSPKCAREAAKAAFAAHGWALIEDSDAHLVGRYASGKRDAVESLTIGDHTISRHSDEYKIDDKRNRTPSKSYERWPLNLKTSLVSELMQVQEEQASAFKNWSKLSAT